jgi:hypothetical protein
VEVAEEIDAAAQDDDRWHRPQDKYGHAFLLHQFEMQTLTLFMPVSASERVL